MTTEKPLTDQEKTEALLNELGIGHEARQGTIFMQQGMAKVDGYSDGQFREIVVGE